MDSSISSKNSFGALTSEDAAYQQIASASLKLEMLTSVAKENTCVLDSDVTRSLRILTYGVSTFSETALSMRSETFACTGSGSVTNESMFTLLRVDTNTCMQLFGSLINFDTFASVPTFFRLPSFSSFNTATNMPPFFSMA